MIDSSTFGSGNVLFNRIDLVCTDKDRELSEAQAEIKALKLSERQREKAVEEVHPLLKSQLYYFA